MSSARLISLGLGLLAALPVAAQGPSTPSTLEAALPGGGANAAAVQAAPLSVIDWLAVPPAEAAISKDALTPRDIPNSAAAPSVATAPLDGGDGGAGLLAPAASGIPATLWSGSSLSTLSRAMDALPAETLAPVAELRKRLLIARTNPPEGASAAEFLAWRVAHLREIAAADEAMALFEETRVTLTPDLFTHYADLAFILGEEDRACAQWRDNAALSDDIALRIVCLARVGDWNAAALALQGALVLGDMPADRGALLAAFLDPELADAQDRFTLAGPVTPLDFRMKEAVGAPLPTENLPRVYALSDLRPAMGWKAQIDAAERLVRTGAVPPARLFELYTARVPAASGSVWDRADAVQTLDAALRAGEPSEVGPALRDAVAAMGAAGLLPALATMVADRLDPVMSLAPEAATAQAKLLLLSDRYESAREAVPEPLQAIAVGDVLGVTSTAPRIAALLDGFRASPENPPEGNASLGETILKALGDLDAATAGDFTGVADALATLRRVGLEDSARRAALHLALLTR
ncbi:MAG: hypothetical protein AAF092_11165 [Pseudomonadota bacterium]